MYCMYIVTAASPMSLGSSLFLNSPRLPTTLLSFSFSSFFLHPGYNSRTSRISWCLSNTFLTNHGLVAVRPFVYFAKAAPLRFRSSYRIPTYLAPTPPPPSKLVWSLPLTASPGHQKTPTNLPTKRKASAHPTSPPSNAHACPPPSRSSRRFAFSFKLPFCETNAPSSLHPLYFGF